MCATGKCPVCIQLKRDLASHAVEDVAYNIGGKERGSKTRRKRTYGGEGNAASVRMLEESKETDTTLAVLNLLNSIVEKGG